MAETLISPGVLARENDQSQITSQPIQAGAAIVGPTVKGQVNIPKLITTYSEYQANFGTTFQSGSDEYTFFTSISAWNYFNNGGTSLIVTKVASGSFTAATSSTIFNDKESGDIALNTNLFGSTLGCDGSDAPYNNTVAFSGGSGTGLTLRATTTPSTGKLDITDAELLAVFNAGTNPTTLGDGTFAVSLTQGSNQTATASAVITGNTITSITVTNTGSGYTAAAIEIEAGSMGSNMLVTGATPTVANGNSYTAGVLTAIEILTSYVNTSTIADAGGGSIIFTVDGGGVPSSATFLQGDSRKWTVGDVFEVPAAALNAAGGGTGTTDVTVTIAAGNVLLLSPAATGTLASTDLYNTLATMEAASTGTGFLVGDVLTIAAGCNRSRFSSRSNNISRCWYSRWKCFYIRIKRSRCYYE